MATNNSLLYERNLADVVRIADESLDTILDKSGTILYSSCETIKPGKYYFLGLNPGGSDENTETIRSSLNQMELGKSRKNAYLDEDWGSDSRSYGKAGHPLQMNFNCLFKALGEVRWSR
jgi:hypothetical protein